MRRQAFSYGGSATARWERGGREASSPCACAAYITSRSLLQLEKGSQISPPQAQRIMNSNTEFGLIE
jgi:hypothetical protein